LRLWVWTACIGQHWKTGRNMWRPRDRGTELSTGPHTERCIALWRHLCRTSGAAVHYGNACVQKERTRFEVADADERRWKTRLAFEADAGRGHRTRDSRHTRTLSSSRRHYTGPDDVTHRPTRTTQIDTCQLRGPVTVTTDGDTRSGELTTQRDDDVVSHEYYESLLALTSPDQLRPWLNSAVHCMMKGVIVVQHQSGHRDDDMHVISDRPTHAYSCTTTSTISWLHGILICRTK